MRKISDTFQDMILNNIVFYDGEDDEDKGCIGIGILNGLLKYHNDTSGDFLQWKNSSDRKGFCMCSTSYSK